MDPESLTLGDVQAIIQRLNGKPTPTSSASIPHPYQVGQPYFIRTVTYFNAGILKAVYAQELVLTQACWVPDTGRLSEQWAKSPEDIFAEVELWPKDAEVIIGRGSVVDALISPSLPYNTKKL